VKADSAIRDAKAIGRRVKAQVTRALISSNGAAKANPSVTAKVRDLEATKRETPAAADEALLAITPIDGRYRSRTAFLRDYFSEFALIRYRVRVEVEWYLSLAQNPAIDAIAPLAPATIRRLRARYEKLSLSDAHRVKAIEAETNHDVKAVEYFLKERIAEIDPKLPVEMVHFACTSEDINNLAYALILKEFVEGELLSRLSEPIAALAVAARRYKSVAMIARTHGQAATPTTVGKELAIFAARLDRERTHLERQEYLGKLNGAVGNFNAHRAAYPEVDWIAHSRAFVESLGLVWNSLTTQIEPHDFIAELFDTLVRIDTILLDFARDMWGYIALGYFRQRVIEREIGSSVMPHKVNPIDFENAEGNLGVATALFQHLGTKLPISRWQRDLSDSTALRTMGAAFGHLVVALESIKRGLERVDIDRKRIAADLDDEASWEVLAEAIQTVMRRYGIPKSYEALKRLTRGRAVDRATIERFVSSLPIPDGAKRALLKLAPRNYVGFAEELVERFTPSPSKSGKANRRGV
jgi:adenylosuccinate lyase